MVLNRRDSSSSKIQDRNEHSLRSVGGHFCISYKSNSPNNLRKIEFVDIFGEKKI